jgi:SAM-dependent methyltransferase
MLGADHRRRVGDRHLARADGWDYLPVDDLAYVHPAEVMAMDDDALRAWVVAFEARRYGGWRNHEGLWRSTLGLDTTYGQHVIDYGCGYGIEALQFAKAGNRITLFDLTTEGLRAARRVLGVFGFKAQVRTDPDNLPDADIFYANGSLHHTPHMAEIMAKAPCPEARLMLYSDKAYRFHGEGQFVRGMDTVGHHADWYDRQRLARVVRDHWRVRRHDYITPNGWYLTATLDRKDQGVSSRR